MHIETNRAIVIYGVGYATTVTLLTPFFLQIRFVRFDKSHMNLCYGRYFYHVLLLI